MSTPEGPAPPSGYRWVPKGQIVWPDDRRCDNFELGTLTTRADAWGYQWSLASEYLWCRLKVTQPDLAWLKSKALDQAKLHPAGSVERERILWAVTEAVRLYSGTLLALVPEREQWRPDQKGGEA